MDAKNVYCTQLLLQIIHASLRITKLQNTKIKYQLFYSKILITLTNFIHSSFHFLPTYRHYILYISFLNYVPNFSVILHFSSCWAL